MKYRFQTKRKTKIGPGERFVKEDCQARKLKTEDAMDCSKWMKLIKDVRMIKLFKIL